jgi:short-subunit dehydrogenase
MPEHLRPLALVVGFDYELAKQLAIAGYDLAIVADSAAALKRAGDNLSKLPEAPHVETITADLSSPTGVQTLYDKVQRLGRAVDALAINLTPDFKRDASREPDAATELQIVQLNVAAPVYLTRLFIKDMVARGEGKVLLTGPLASATPAPYCAVYSASKAFLRCFGQALNTELIDTHVQVTVLLPAPTAAAAVKALEEGEGLMAPVIRNTLQAGVNKLMGEL